MLHRMLKYNIDISGEGYFENRTEQYVVQMIKQWYKWPISVFTILLYNIKKERKCSTNKYFL